MLKSIIKRLKADGIATEIINGNEYIFTMVDFCGCEITKNGEYFDTAENEYDLADILDDICE